MDGDPWLEFLKWEGASRDTIDFKTIYVDMADDLVAGILLSQIIYWYLPDKKGRSKLRVFKDGYYWIAKARHEWWDEIRVKSRQIDRAVAILEEKGIIIIHLYRFNNAPTMHIRIDKEGFLDAWNAVLARFNETVKSEPSEDPFSPNLQFDFTDSSNGDDETVKSDLPESAKSLTETTINFPETTAENTNDFSQKPKADPLLFEKERETLAQREAAGSNYAVPAPAGGSDLAAEAALLAIYDGLGSDPPRRGTASWKDEIGIVGQVLRGRGLTDLDLAEKAGELFGKANRETLHFANLHLSTFPGAFGVVVGRIMKQAASANPDPRAHDIEAMQESLAALEERRAAQSPPPEDDAVGRQVKMALEGQVQRHLFQKYVALSRFAYDDGVLIVTAPNAFARDWLEDRLGKFVTRAMDGFVERPREVRFEVAAGEAER